MSATETSKLLVSAEEAARMLSIGKSTFWDHVRRNLAPQPVKVGGLTRWRVSDLQRHVQAMSPTTT